MILGDASYSIYLIHLAIKFNSASMDHGNFRWYYLENTQCSCSFAMVVHRRLSAGDVPFIKMAKRVILFRKCQLIFPSKLELSEIAK